MKQRYVLFYTDECSACDALMPNISRLLQETGVEVAPLDVGVEGEASDWFDQIAESTCNGVPMILDTTTQRFLCGDVDYQMLYNFVSIS